MSPPEPKIYEVLPVAPGYLQISLHDGRTGILNMTRFLETKFFKRLAVKKYFKQVAILHNGAGIGWPEGQDLSVDTVIQHWERTTN